MSKIICDSIQFKNVFSYGNTEQTFNLEKGITFITGLNTRNNRRNFTGKTSLLRVFPLALFGKVEGLNKTNIVNWKNRKNAETKFNVTIGDNQYCIHRGIKPDFLKVYENGRELPEPASKADFQKWIEEELLNTSISEFMTIDYCDTNNYKSFFKSGKPERRAFMERVFNLEYYTTMKDKVNKRLQDVETKITNTNNDIQRNQEKIDALYQQTIQYEHDRDNLGDHKETLKVKEQEIEKYRKQNEGLEQEEKTLREEKDRLTKEKDKVHETCFKLSSKIKEVNRKIRSIPNKTIDEINGELKEIQERKSLNEQRYEKVKNVVESKDQIQEQIDELNNNLVDMKSRKNTKESEMNTISGEISTLSKKIEHPNVEETCPTCFQKTDYDVIRNTLNEQKTELEKSFNTARDEFSKLREQIEGLEGDLEDLKKKLKLVDVKEKLEQELRDIDEELQAKDEKKKQIKKRINLIEALDKLNSTYEGYQPIHQMKIDEIEKIDEQLVEIQDKREKKTNLEKELDHLKEKVNMESEQRERLNKYIENNKDQIKAIEEENKQKSKTYKKLQIMKDHLKYLKDVCSDNKARQYAISNKMPFINKKINDYLSVAGVNFYVKLNNLIDPPEIRGPGIKNCTYENLSGAERISLDRAFQFACLDLLSFQNTSSMDVLILDEFLDSSVDEMGLKNIMEIVSNIQKSKDNKVLIVSHRSELGELRDYVDYEWRTVYNGKYSHLEQVK